MSKKRRFRPGFDVPPLHKGRRPEDKESEKLVRGQLIEEGIHPGHKYPGSVEESYRKSVAEKEHNALENAQRKEKEIPEKKSKAGYFKVGDKVIHKDGTKGTVIKILDKKDSSLIQKRWPDRNITKDGEWIMIRWFNPKKKGKNPFLTQRGQKLKKI